jgi:hypothetical protein
MVRVNVYNKFAPASNKHCIVEEYPLVQIEFHSSILDLHYLNMTVGKDLED